MLSATLAETEAYTLVSLWKPLLWLVLFVPWAVVVSKVLDKHAARFHLNREMWGLIHLIVGTVAVLGAISIPLVGEAAFWIGFGVMALLLIGDVVVYAMVTNRDERVPEKYHLTLDLSRWTAAREEKRQKGLQAKVELAIRGPSKEAVPVPEAGTPEFEVRTAAENVFLRALSARATQIDFAPAGKDGAYLVTFLVDGVRVPAVLSEPERAKDGPPPPPPGVLTSAEALRIMDFWRAAGKMDVNERRKKQVADVSVERGTQRTKVRLTSIGSQAGLRLSMLLDPEKQVQRKPEALGLLEPQWNVLREIVTGSKGIVLLTSPPDNGRTTLLYSVLKMHDAYTSNVQTLEIDQQDVLEGVRQNIFDPQTEGAEFSTTLRSILRRDPDVVGVAEVPDAATVKEAARLDVERCRVYLSFRADSAVGAVQTFVKAHGDPAQAAKVLAGVVNGRVLRKLCVNCRQAYQPGAEMLKKLGLPADRIKQLFRKGGQVLVKNKPETCPACAGVGYVGLEGVYEVYPIGEAERAAIIAQDYNALRMEFRKRNLPTLQQAALRKALDGITSVEEMLRVTTDEASKPPAGTPRAASPAAPQAS
jgi:type II secretory ATPase GspE/PulE/Tfp pilus assembly ATPase PilB-like protein